MNYFKNKENKVFAYDNEQVKQGFGKDLTAITEEEMKVLTTPVYTEEELKQQEMNKLKQYLADTDFYMTVDKYETLTIERQEELKAKRAEARDLINQLEAKVVDE
jgi:uncharacterized protein YcgL (UPF0745 family)